MMPNLTFVALAVLYLTRTAASYPTDASDHKGDITRIACSLTCDLGTPSTPGCTNLGGGSFRFIGSGNGDGICGKGWQIGTKTQVIQYSGDYQPNGTSFLGVYGWTRTPLIEYYIIESYGPYNPSSAAARKGSVTCDGANYDILSTIRVNQPSIDGTQTFQQFWSVRNPKKTPGGAINGTVTTACHFGAWSQYGMNLGASFDYQMLAVERYFSTVNATLTIL